MPTSLTRLSRSGMRPMTKPDQPWWFVARTGWGFTIEASYDDAMWLRELLANSEDPRAGELADKLNEAIEGVA